MEVASWQIQSYTWFLEHAAPAPALYKSPAQWAVLEMGMDSRVKPEEDGCQTAVLVWTQGSVHSFSNQPLAPS